MRMLVVEVNGEPYCRAGVDEGAVSAFVSHVNIPDEPGGPGRRIDDVDGQRLRPR